MATAATAACHKYSNDIKDKERRKSDDVDGVDENSISEGAEDDGNGNTSEDAEGDGFTEQATLGMNAVSQYTPITCITPPTCTHGIQRGGEHSI